MQFSFFWSESFGQIYPQLRKLSEDGLIEEISLNVLTNIAGKCNVKLFLLMQSKAIYTFIIRLVSKEVVIAKRNLRKGGLK